MEKSHRWDQDFVFISSASLTVVVYVLVDIIFCWEDLAHRSEERLRNKRTCTHYRWFPLKKMWRRGHESFIVCKDPSNDVWCEVFTGWIRRRCSRSIVQESELMEINSMQEAGCERNKGRHGGVMNNLGVEQQDLNTWVCTCMEVHGGPLLATPRDIIKARRWLSVQITAGPLANATLGKHCLLCVSVHNSRPREKRRTNET